MNRSSQSQRGSSRLSLSGSKNNRGPLGPMPSQNRSVSRSSFNAPPNTTSRRVSLGSSRSRRTLMGRSKSDTGPPKTGPPKATNTTIRHSKSDISGDTGPKHLVDYSTKRATYNQASRSQCRGPVMSRLIMPKNNGAQKSISARGLDWNALNDTMDLSSERADEVRNMSDKSEQDLQGKDERMKRSSSSRLRLQLARSRSTNLVVEPETSLGKEKKVSPKEEGVHPPPRWLIQKSKSVGSSTLKEFAFQRPAPRTSTRVETPAA